jgi:hypothetical protein
MRVDYGTPELHRQFGAILSCDEIETRTPALATPPIVSFNFWASQHDLKFPGFSYLCKTHFTL